MQSAKYANIIMDAIDSMAGWYLLTSSELQETTHITVEILKECKTPGIFQRKALKVYVFISIATALLNAGVTKHIPVFKAVRLANEYLVKALSILLRS